MNTFSIVLSAILTLALIIIIAPNIIAMQRGNAMRNIAIWLAIFATLGLIYQYFGPDSAHPLFKQPEAFQGMKPMPAIGKTNETRPDTIKGDDAHDYAPPKEEE